MDYVQFGLGLANFLFAYLLWNTIPRMSGFNLYAGILSVSLSFM